MHHKVSRRALVALLAAVSLLAIPSVASAHFFSKSWDYPQSGGTHNLTCNEAIWIGVANTGNFHGGVLRVGNCLAFSDGWPYYQQHTYGWRANDNALMQTTVRETFSFGPSHYDWSSSHQ